MQTSVDVTEIDSTQESITKLSSDDSNISPQHPLEHRYAVWMCPRRKGGRFQCSISYAEQIRLIGQFETVEQFWATYAHLKKTEELSELSDLFVFKDGIRPMWEDEPNREGGRLAVHMAKRNSGRMWEMLLLALVGEQITLCCQQINGIAFSPKPHDDIISVWCRGGSGPDQEALRNRIKSSFMRILNIPSTLTIDYRPHSNAINSCRNKNNQQQHHHHKNGPNREYRHSESIDEHGDSADSVHSYSQENEPTP